MRIQSIAVQPFYKGNVNKPAETSKVSQYPNVTFNGEYAKAFRKGMKTIVRGHGDSCDILTSLREAMKKERIVQSQAYRRFSQYAVGEFIGQSARSSYDMIIAEPVEMTGKPYMEIKDGVLICHDPDSYESMAFFYNPEKRAFSFQRTMSGTNHSVVTEFYKYWRNGKIEEKVTTHLWDGGSSTETEYFDTYGNPSTFWRNLFQ